MHGLGGVEGLGGRLSWKASDVGLGKLIRSSESELMVDVGLPKSEQYPRKAVVICRVMVAMGS